MIREFQYKLHTPLQKFVKFAQWILVNFLVKIKIIQEISRDDLRTSQSVVYYKYDGFENHSFELPPALPIEVTRDFEFIKRSKSSINSIDDAEYKTFRAFCGERFVAELRDIRILGPHAFAVNKKRKIPLEQRANIKGYDGVLDDQFRSTLYHSGPIKTISHVLGTSDYDESLDVVASLLTGRRKESRPPAYGHWLLEILPRIRGVDHYTHETGIKPKLLVYDDLTTWQLETLAVLGYSGSDLIKWDSGAVTVDRYVVPKWPKGELCISDLEWMKSEFESSIDYGQYIEDFSSRIYLSRENIPRRRVANRPELLTLLSSLGFQSICPETLSVAEQIALFKNADVIVGPAGSAFSNIIFCENSKIIEMFNSHSYSTWNWGLAQKLDVDYHSLIGESAESERRGWHRDFTVDTASVTELLNELGID